MLIHSGESGVKWFSCGAEAIPIAHSKVVMSDIPNGMADTRMEAGKWNETSPQSDILKMVNWVHQYLL
jgi:hypothetical protein